MAMTQGNRERRGALRVRWRAPLRYRHVEDGSPVGALMDGHLADMSSSGALIATAEYLRVGSTIALLVVNDDPPLDLKTLAVVVRRAESSESSEHCAGVEFRGLPARRRADLAAFILLQASRLGQLQHHTDV